MKCVIATAFTFASVAHSVAQEPAKVPEIHVRDLNRLTVIGEMGVPLGTVAKVDAVIVAGRTFGAKGLPDYMLRIVKVDGAVPARPPVLEFSSWPQIGLVNDQFELHRLKTGQAARSLDEEQLAELEKSYVGKRLTLLVYETGGFSGIPNNLPPGHPVVAGRSFSFSTKLVLVEEVAR